MPNVIPAEIASFYSYDPETGAFCRTHNRAGNPIVPPRPITARSGSRVSHYAFCFFGKLYKVHRTAWFLMTGEQPPEVIDHVNGDPLDNRWINLRAATTTQNLWNMRTRRNGLKGVAFDKRRGRYYSLIRIGEGRRINLGYYDTEQAAHAAYCAAAEKYHGEFARTE